MSLLKIAVEKLLPSQRSSLENDSDIQLTIYYFSCFIFICPFAILLKATQRMPKIRILFCLVEMKKSVYI